MNSIKMIIRHQLLCNNLVLDVGNGCIPKQIFCDQWPIESQNNGRPLKYYKNLLNSNIPACELDSDHVKEMVIDQPLEKGKMRSRNKLCFFRGGRETGLAKPQTSTINVLVPSASEEAPISLWPLQPLAGS